MWTLQVAIQRLRERLSHALGQQAAAPAAPTHVRRAYPQQPATAQPLPQHSFTPIQPAMVPRPAAAAPVPVPTPAASAPAQPQYYQPVCMLNKFLLLWFSSDLCETCITMSFYQEASGFTQFCFWGFMGQTYILTTSTDMCPCWSVTCCCSHVIGRVFILARV